MQIDIRTVAAQDVRAAVACYRIDIWRVLHAQRDIPTHLAAGPPT